MRTQKISKFCGCSLRLYAEKSRFLHKSLKKYGMGENFKPHHGRITLTSVISRGVFFKWRYLATYQYPITLQLLESS